MLFTKTYGRVLAPGLSVLYPGLPEDVANAILFFASAKTGFVTGEARAVTGGMYQLW